MTIGFNAWVRGITGVKGSDGSFRSDEAILPTEAQLEVMRSRNWEWTDGDVMEASGYGEIFRRLAERKSLKFADTDGDDAEVQRVKREHQEMESPAELSPWIQRIGLSE